MQSAAIKNQDFNNVSQSLDSFLNNLPSNNVSPSDDLAEVNAKQISQEVSVIINYFLFLFLNKQQLEETCHNVPTITLLFSSEGGRGHQA